VVSRLTKTFAHNKNERHSRRAAIKRGDPRPIFNLKAKFKVKCVRQEEKVKFQQCAFLSSSLIAAFTLFDKVSHCCSAYMLTLKVAHNLRVGQD
jgi:hypothetical protein